MDKREIDDRLYAAMTDALANSGLPITARAKARIADELCAEAVRLVLVQMKQENAAATAAPAKTRKTRKPRAAKQAPADPTIPLPFGQAQ